MKHFKAHHNRLLAALIATVLMLGGRLSATAQADAEALVDRVYAHTFSDIHEAQATMDSLRHSGLLPECRLNLVEGDLNFNRGRFFEALKFYKRAYHDKAAAADSDVMKELLRRLVMSYDNVHNNTNLLYYAHKMLDLGRETNDGAAQSVALFSIGKVHHFVGEKAKGMDEMRQAVALMRQQPSRIRYDQLFYDYSSMIEMMQDDGDNEAGLRLLREMDNFVQTEKDESGHTIDKLNDSRMKDVYAHYAVLLNRLGQAEEAERYYNLFVGVGDAQFYDYTCIKPYMLEKGLWADLLRFLAERKTFLTEQGDTLGYDMTNVLQTEAEAYMAKGDHLGAAHSYATLTRLLEKIKAAEEISGMDELSSNYELHDREIEMEREKWRIIVTSIVAVVVIILLSVGYIVRRTIRHNRIITEKNRAMARSIDDLMRLKEPAPAAPPVLPRQESEASVSTEEKPAPRAADDNSALLFERIRAELIDRRAYLDPNLSRDVLLERLNIPKNSFSQLFRQYAGTTYTRYINDLRLEHAVKMLSQQPNFTIEAVATESGLSARTLYSLFQQKFGMSPAEYRTAHERNMNEPPQDTEE